MELAGKIIGIVGVPGSGKTTLGKNLESLLGCHLFEENWKDNPYAHGPKSKDAHGLEVSIGFLVLRKDQYEEAKKMADNGKCVIMDTVFGMTDLYSKYALDQIEYEFFSKIYKNFSDDVSSPDVLIYLHAPYDVLVKRGKKRNLGIELEKIFINKSALESTDKLIKKFISTIDPKNIISINVSTFDVRDPQVVESLAKKIKDL